MGMRRLAVDPVAVSRSYEIVSSRGTHGNTYQRLLEFTTARRKAPDGLLNAVLARYLVGRVRASRASRDSPGDGARSVECVTITIPAEPPPGARRRDAVPARRPIAARSAGPRRP